MIVSVLSSKYPVQCERGSSTLKASIKWGGGREREVGHSCWMCTANSSLRGDSHTSTLPRVWITWALSFWSSWELAPPLNLLGREWQSTPVADINQNSCPLTHPSHFLYFLGLMTHGLPSSILLRLRLNAFVYPCTFLISMSSPSSHPPCDGCICPSALLSPEGLAFG